MRSLHGCHAETGSLAAFEMGIVPRFAAGQRSAATIKSKNKE
jgi:hypothetical protein